MNTQTSSPSQSIKNSPIRRLLLVVSGALLIIIGIASPFFQWYGPRAPADDSGLVETLMAFLLVTIPCVTIGIVLLMLNVIYKATQPTQRYWPGAIACFFAAIALVSRLIAISPAFLQILIPMTLRDMLAWLSVISPIITLGCGICALYLTRGIGLQQGRLLAYIAFSLGLILTALLCIQIR